MNDLSVNRLILSTLVLTAVLAGCHRNGESEVGELSDDPIVQKVTKQDLAEEVPAYGVVLSSGQTPSFEVNIEAEDSPLVKSGQRATALVPPGDKPLACQVTSVARGVSTETGQAIAWLKGLQPSTIERGEFISASIAVSLKKDALTVPRQAILVRDGGTWVIRQEAGKGNKPEYKAVSVQTGVVSGNLIEIKSGLNDGDLIVTDGQIGFLNPDFKATAGD